MPDPVVHIIRESVTSNRNLTVAQLVQRCIDESGDDLDRAVRLAGRYSRGARARATVREISNTLLRGGAS
jgi:hypothetical protein